MIDDIDCAHQILAEGHENNAWDLYSVVAIDAICSFGAGMPGRSACGDPVREIVVLLFSDGQGMHALAVCSKHQKIVERAIQERRGAQRLEDWN